MDAAAISNIAQTLGSYHWDADEKLNSDGTWTMISCPLAPWEPAHHNGRDMHPSFAVNCESGASVCKCYSCDFVGPMSAVVKRVYENEGINEHTLMELMKFITIEEQRSYTVDEITYTPDLPEFLTSYLYRSHGYMAKRGLDETDIAKWGLGYSADLDRMLIPFYDTDGTLLSIVGRDVSGEHDMKYMIYPSGFPKSRYLFGETKLSGEEEAILIVEGYLDAVIASKYLPTNIGVVAIGTAIPSPRQLRRILALAPEIVLGLDNPEFDKAGEKGFEKCKKFLLGNCKLTTVDYRQFKDAGEAGDKIATIVEHREGDLLLAPVKNLLGDILERLTQTQKSSTIEVVHEDD